MTGWRRSRPLVVVAIVVFLVVQLSVPIIRFGDGDRAQRFAWQMFSTAEVAPAFVVHTSSGEAGIDLDAYMARPRSDIDILGLMPAHLCATHPDADLITWQGGEHTC